MANKTSLWALITGVGLWLMIMAAPAAAIAGGACCSPPSPPAGCGCTPPPCCTPPTPPPTSPQCCSPANNIVVPGIDVFVAPSVVVNVQASANASAFSAAGAQAQTTPFVNGGGGGGFVQGGGAVGMVNLNIDNGGTERTAYEAERSRVEKVIIQAFCFDDKDVPHPASQTSPDRDIAQDFDGELYRCIAGAHMQVTIAHWNDKISFEGGQTLTCAKGEALYHIAGKDAGRLECRPQKPARDCNERSLLRRFGAGIKVLTIAYTEKYTAYREETHTSTASSSGVMSLDGGVGGVVY